MGKLRILYRFFHGKYHSRYGQTVMVMPAFYIQDQLDTLNKCITVAEEHLPTTKRKGTAAFINTFNHAQQKYLEIDGYLKSWGQRPDRSLLEKLFDTQKKKLKELIGAVALAQDLGV